MTGLHTVPGIGRDHDVSAVWLIKPMIKADPIQATLSGTVGDCRFALNVVLYCNY